MTPPKGLLLVTMEPPAALEEEFNDWYDTEHFPQRRSLPGFESASRWVCLEGWPRWVALYDLRTVAALETPEYRAVSGPNSTPWSRRVLPRTMGRTRVIAEQVFPGDAVGRAPGDVARLVVAEYARPVDPAACAQAAGTLAGLAQVRAFRSLGAAPAQMWVLAEFDRPQARGAVHDAFAAIDGVGALLLNTYAPYPVADQVRGADIMVAANGVTLSCRIDGPAGAPWLVFSNSLMTDRSLWDSQVAAFEGRFRILRYDQRGHGGSPVPSGDCTFDQLVDDLAALLEHFDVTAATVAGVSMGGVTALGLAARHPARVARVAICDCQAIATGAGAAAWEERIAVARAGGMAVLVEPTVARWFRPDFVARHPPALERVRAMIAHTPLDGFIRGARALQHYDFRAALATLRCPASFIVGAADGALPGGMRGMVALTAGAAFTEVADAGHLPNIEQPASFEAALSALLAMPPNRS